MECFFVHPSKIKIREGQKRYRTALGDVSSLAKSIKEKRQILPIIVTRNYELVDGGRRLAACILAGKDVKCTFEDIADDAELRELEIEANCFREDFTPADYAAAVADYHRLKQQRHGAAKKGSITDGWGITETANALGVSRAQVEKQLQIDQMVQSFPDLKEAKTATEIQKAAKGMQRIATAAIDAVKHQKLLDDGKKTFSLIQADAEVYLPTIPDASFDILLTDPIYGIDADLQCHKIGGLPSGTFNTSGFMISDRKADAFRYYKLLAKESFRFTKPTSHAYIFSSPEHIRTVYFIFKRAGWLPHIRPIIWIKRETGQCTAPSCWPSSCYEMILYCRRSESSLVKLAQPDWIECPPIHSSKRKHPYEKPVELLTNLLSRCSFPGQTLIDPFMGSGSSIEAGLRQNLICTGIEIDNASFVTAQSRIALVYEELKNR